MIGFIFMNKKVIACLCSFNPAHMMYDIVNKLMSYRISVSYHIGETGEFIVNTPNITLYIFLPSQILNGLKFDEVFGFPSILALTLRKNPKSNPYRDSLIDYILTEEEYVKN